MSDFRQRVLEPALIPLGAFLFIGILVFGFSRFLLTTTVEGAVVLGTLMSGCILFAAAALAKGGSLKPVQRAVLVLFGVLVIAGGVTTGAVLNTREVHKELEVAATISAQGLAFDRKELKLPADEPFALEFHNNEAQPHNVGIYPSPTQLAAPFLKGEIFTGPGTQVYEEDEGIPAGLYYFQCDVHPTMNGAALVGEEGGTPPAGPSPGAGASPAGPSLVARALAFDQTEIVLPANRPSELLFDNQEAGVQHNVSIYPDAQSFDALFRGELIVGPAQRRYQIPALPPGTYQFRCDVHPQMAGTVIVR